MDTETIRYWTRKRKTKAAYYQYHVYREAYKWCKRLGLEEAIDLGCGTGAKTIGLLKKACARVVGIDQPNAIQICKETYPDEEFYVDLLEEPSLALESLGLWRSFDLVISADVIEHLADPDKLLRYAAKVAKNGAHFVLSTPERDVAHGLGSLTPPNIDHVREWNEAEFGSYVRSRGFEVLTHRTVPEQRANLNVDYLRFLLRLAANLRSTKACQMLICRVWHSNLSIPD